MISCNKAEDHCNNNEMIKFDVDSSGGIKFVKKLGKLKGQKLSKFYKMFKSKNCQKVGIYLNTMLKKLG